MGRALSGIASLVLATLLFAAAAPRADDPLVAKAQLQKLESVAKEVASKGRDSEMNDLIDVVRRMGEEPAVLSKLRSDCSKALAAVKSPQGGPALVGIAHGLHSFAGDLGKQLGRLEDTPRGTLAELLLRLDGTASGRARRASGGRRGGPRSRRRSSRRAASRSSSRRRRRPSRRSPPSTLRRPRRSATAASSSSRRGRRRASSASSAACCAPPRSRSSCAGSRSPCRPSSPVTSESSCCCTRRRST